MPPLRDVPGRRFRLLAVDVDGTLMMDGAVSPADAEALRRAARAGIVVCLCTGRSWEQVRPIWESLALPPPHAPVVCVGGALVTEPRTHRTLYARPFERPTAADLGRELRRRGYPVMALVDAWREGFDYCLVGRADQPEIYRRFLAGRELRIRWADELGRPADPRPLRINVFDEHQPADRLVADLRRRFAGRIEVQRIHLIHLDLHVVEAFAAGANKFTALRYVGQGQRISPRAMAAIGDDHNDIPMLQQVGLSAAPADAPEQVRAAAGRVVASRGRAPVAEFVNALLEPPGRRGR